MMENVYVAFGSRHGEEVFLGVFATMENANEFVKSYGETSNFGDFDIREEKVW
jgi:hypothetical protein